MKAADPAMRKGSRSALRIEKYEKGEPMGFPEQLNRAAGVVGCICSLNLMGGKQLGRGARSQKIISATGGASPLVWATATATAPAVGAAAPSSGRGGR